MTAVTNGPLGPIEGLSARGMHVGSYKRRMNVSLNRMYENALDWEHLPYLHSSSFAWIELIEGGDWGWRAKVGLGGSDGSDDRSHFIVLQLHLDRERHRWISSTLEGPGKGSEIWTHAFEVGDGEIEILADFFIPNVDEKNRARLGASYEALYALLYDEDEGMMSERQVQLDTLLGRHQLPGSKHQILGSERDIRGQLPFTFTYNKREFRLVEDAGELIAHVTVCPHILGPLSNAEVDKGLIECPWHGYKFDIRSGASQTGQKCKLPTAPKITVDEQANIIASD